MVTTYYPEQNGRTVSEYPIPDVRGSTMEIPKIPDPNDTTQKIGLWFGPEITSTVEFNEVRIVCTCVAHTFHVAIVYNDGVKISEVPGNFRKVYGENLTYDHDFPEVVEVRRRVENGTCRVTYMDAADLDTGNNVATPFDDEDFGPPHWLLATLHPFHGGLKYDFFHELIKGMDYVAPDGDNPQEFHFPGKVVENLGEEPVQEFRYFKRGDDLSTPAASSLSGLTDAGWSLTAPYGPHELHAIDVTETGGDIMVNDAFRVYHMRKDLDTAIASVARKWNRYWYGLTATEKAVNNRVTARNHFEHAIGRAWADKPHDSAERIFYQGESSTETRDKRDMEDWMLGNLEQWAHVWGFPAFVTAISTGGKRTILNSELTDYTFCHVNEDGSVGDRLYNGASGITQTTWNEYQSVHYVAAIRHGLSPVTASAQPVSVTQGITTLANVSVSGGYGSDYTFAKVTTESWFTIDQNGNLRLEPTTSTTVGEHTVQISVTDGIFDPVTVDVVVTVAAAS